ncbi:DUF86 domain-containing protein [Myxococcota bacterium]|nr:DUF86 domain-containing protein [Myxococcota bacterium]
MKIRSRSRDSRQYLDDILECIGRVLTYTEGRTFAEVVADRMRWDAVLRNLEVIGEAARQIPEDFRRAHPQVEWRDVADFRNVVAHEYFGIDVEIVRTVVEVELGELERQVRLLRAEMGD